EPLDLARLHPLLLLCPRRPSSTLFPYTTLFRSLAFEDPAGLAAARVVAGARHRLAERNAFAVLAVFGKRPVRDTLLVAQLDARKVEHAVLHGTEHLLAAPGAHALVERGHDAEGEVQAGAGIADLRAGEERRA